MKIKLLIPVLFLFISSISFAQQPTSEILDEAYKQATLENKSVLVVFQASWCSWCKKMDQNLNNDKIKESIEANYVVVHLSVLESKKNTHLENPGAEDLLREHNAVKAGLPYWLIFDKDKNLIGNSLGSDNQNMGCPSTKQEVIDLKATLKKTSSLTEEELNSIGEVFYIEKK